MGIAETTLIFKLGIVCSMVGFVFHLIGLASPYWTSVTVAKGTIFAIESHTGLWRGCVGSICGDVQNPPSWMQASQAFAILGFLAGLAAVGLTLAYVVIEQLRKDIVYIIASIGNLAAAFCIFLTVVIFGAKVSSGLNWSFGLSIVGMLFHLGAGILMGVNRFQNKPQ